MGITLAGFFGILCIAVGASALLLAIPAVTDEYNINIPFLTDANHWLGGGLLKNALLIGLALVTLVPGIMLIRVKSRVEFAQMKKLTKEDKKERKNMIDAAEKKVADCIKNPGECCNDSEIKLLVNPKLRSACINESTAPPIMFPTEIVKKKQGCLKNPTYDCCEFATEVEFAKKHKEFKGKCDQAEAKAEAKAKAKAAAKLLPAPPSAQYQSPGPYGKADAKAQAAAKPQYQSSGPYGKAQAAGYAKVNGEKEYGHLGLGPRVSDDYGSMPSRPSMPDPLQAPPRPKTLKTLPAATYGPASAADVDVDVDVDDDV